MNESICIICYETLNHNNIYLLNCCKQSMCNVCLNKLKKLICPLCRKSINNEITISHSYTPQPINQINFNFNEISYDDDQIFLDFRTRRHNRINSIRRNNEPYSRPSNNSINREIIKQGIEEHTNNQDEEFSFDDQFN